MVNIFNSISRWIREANIAEYIDIWTIMSRFFAGGSDSESDSDSDREQVVVRPQAPTYTVSSIIAQMAIFEIHSQYN